MATAAKANGVIVSIDIDNAFAGIEGLLPLIDIFTASSSFAEKLTGFTNAKSALIEIRARFGCGITSMTLGRKGSIMLCEDTFIETAGFDVPGGCVDTTGAGDAFRVGLLYGLLTGESMEESAKLANAVAALKCRAVGARSALPDRNELDSFIKNI
jgi:sulfofructose kinase